MATTSSLVVGCLLVVSLSGCATTDGLVASAPDAPSDLIPVQELAAVPLPESSGHRTDVDSSDRTEDEAQGLIRPVSALDDDQISQDRWEPEASGPGMTLQDFEQLAMARNPAIRQASAAAASAAGVRTQVGLRPNPTVGYFADEIGDSGAAGLQGAFVSQTFVRGDKLKWNRQVISHDVNAMNWQIEARRQRVRTDIQVVFYQALAAQERLKLSREFRETVQHGVRITQERVQARIGSRPDVLQSEIQLNEVELAIQQAEFDYEAAWKELAALAGTPDMQPQEVSGDFRSTDDVRSLQGEFSRIEGSSPLLASARARADRARANLKRQRLQTKSNVTAQVGVGHNDSTGDEFASVQLSVPVPVHNRNQGNISAAYAEYCEATQNVARMKLQIRRDLARALREYEVARATVHRYEHSILPRAQEALQLIQDAQAAGEFDFLRVLTTRRACFDAQTSLVTAEGQLAQAVARLDGLLLTGGLSAVRSYEGDDSLRGQTLNGQ